MSKTFASFLTVAAAGAAVCLVVASAQAHVSIVSGPGFADTTQEIVFGVGHGAQGADTSQVRLTIPEGVTSVRPLNGELGKGVVEKDAAGTVVAITWTKPAADLLPEDTNYYRFSVRFKVPNKPFTVLYLPVTQVSQSPAGASYPVAWAELPGTPDAGVRPDGAAEEPAPSPGLVILPARTPGWNKYTVPVTVTDLTWFKDAQIVWAGTGAYSANPSTLALIKSEPGTQVLTEIKAGSEIWVKY